MRAFKSSDKQQYSNRNNRAANKKSRVFTPVDYRQFRQHLADFASTTIEGKGFETIIYDQHGDIQAIVHAASIDNSGRCFPAEYFIRSQALPLMWTEAA